MKRFKKIIVIVLSFILIAGVSSFIYINDFYHADNVDKYLKSSDIVSVKKEDYGMSFKSKNSKDAFIFYPGAKVEYIAYSKLLYKLASKGIDCYLIKMPANLAILDSNKADKVINTTKYDNYYIGGHSLGGAMASNYTCKNNKKLNGLILLASYSTKDLSKSNLKVLSIYGSNDLVLKLDSYKKYKTNLPKDYKEIVIKGGNHAGFASYGPQKHDGEIKNKKQINITVDEISEFIID